MAELRIVFPAIDENALSSALRKITAAIDAKLGRDGGYGLGGESGYGAPWDSAVFMMHPFCWCEASTCPWCAGCECEVGSYHYLVDGKEVDFDAWRSFYQRLVTADIHSDRETWERQSTAANARRTTRHDATCSYCLGTDHLGQGSVAGRGAPNFWHKPSGLKVWWYKYIGRGMEVVGNGDLAAILAECLTDIASLTHHTGE